MELSPYKSKSTFRGNNLLEDDNIPLEISIKYLEDKHKYDKILTKLNTYDDYSTVNLDSFIISSKIKFETIKIMRQNFFKTVEKQKFYRKNINKRNKRPFRVNEELSKLRFKNLIVDNLYEKKNKGKK